jgi:ferredoxin
MIIGEQKPLEEIREMVGQHKKVLVLGCGTCVTVCFAGGEKEAAILASMLRMSDAINDVDGRSYFEDTVKRQCEWEYLDAIAEEIQSADLVLSMACGIGVQAIAERFPQVHVAPAINTTFLGMPVEHGLFLERCAACGNCVLGATGGICPIARCSKSLLNGPCGGSQYGRCEVAPDIPCAWQLIYDRLATLGRLDEMEAFSPPKDWRTAGGGGPRKIVREDLKVEIRK